MKNDQNPQGMLNGTFVELFEAGCIQTSCDVYTDVARAFIEIGPRFHGVMTITSQNPCNGCPAYNGGKCLAFQQYHSAHGRRTAQAQPSETVAQIAARLGISKSEVRRRKQAGTLNQE
jgi:hypothetical protein